MEKKVLIVDDEFVVANDLRMILSRSGFDVCGMADSYEEAMALIEKQKPDIVLLDIYLKGAKTGIDLAHALTEKDIAFVYLSANNNQQVLADARATQPYGFLVKPFREKDVLVALDIAWYRHAHSLEAKLRKEQTLQIALSNIMVEDIIWQERLGKMARQLQHAVPFDFLIIGMKYRKVDLDRKSTFFRIGFDEYQTIQLADFFSITGIPAQLFSEMEEMIIAEGFKIYNGDDFTVLCAKSMLKKQIAKKFQMQSNLIAPINVTDDGYFLLSFFSLLPDVYTPDHLQLLRNLQPSLELAVDRLVALYEIKQLSEQLKREKIYLQEEVKTNANFEEIIGTSHSLLQVFDKVTQVAYLDTSVLLLGESGTGKELVARAIHNMSPRKDKLLIKVNCSALPASLIESELFGHEKGAFTGATDRRIGKFELAQGSTIFLDEIGELPLDLQAKLLRVLQEKEIERIGGKQTIKVDIRIIAATNRDLEKEITEGKFRLDLYYRLNVFPITLPPLRERKEDIPLLADFFARKFAKKTGKPFNGIKPSALEEMMTYDWPGNIREMENVMEQAFVLNDGKSPLQWGRPLVNNRPAGPSRAAAHPPSQSLPGIKAQQQTAEKDYILSVLRKTNGRVRGLGGAAEFLKMKPTTLESRMAKLGIKKERG